jgi:hypothetical protein
VRVAFGSLDFDLLGYAAFGVLDFLADDTFNDTLDLSATTATSRTGGCSRNGSFAGGRGTRISSVGASGISRIGGISVGITASASSSVADNVGAREDVCDGWVVDILVPDTWVAGAITTRESDDITSSGKFGIGASGCTETNLNARRVKLGTTFSLTIMKSEEFVSDKVFTSRQVARDRSTQKSITVAVIVGHEPVGIGVVSSLFVNLEPFGLSGIEFGTATTAARGHIGEDWASVVDPWTVFTVHPTETEL